MKILFKLLSTVSLSSTAVAAEQQQFDLVCKYQGGEDHYRVDLSANEACLDSCERVWKMGAPTSGELKLLDQSPAYRGALEQRATVNRATGDYHYFVAYHGVTVHDGQCESAPFSGFPARKF